MTEAETKVADEQARRRQEQAFVQEHIETFWQAARDGFSEQGRGALFILPSLVVITAPGESAGRAQLQYDYLPLSQMQAEPELLRQCVQSYDPAREFIAVLSWSAEDEMMYTVRAAAEAAPAKPPRLHVSRTE